MIRKARRIPIKCEFMEYTEDNRDEVVKWLGSWYLESKSYEPLIVIKTNCDPDNYYFAAVGDYIVCDTDLDGNTIFTPMTKESFENNYMEELRKAHEFPYYIKRPVNIERVGGKVIQHLSIDQKTVDHIFYKFKDVADAYSPEMPQFIFEGYEMAFEYISFLEDELKKCKDWIEKHMGD